MMWILMVFHKSNHPMVNEVDQVVDEVVAEVDDMVIDMADNNVNKLQFLRRDRKFTFRSISQTSTGHC